MASESCETAEAGVAGRDGAALDMMILFVTSRCNARCGTCFYHHRLNGPGDLTLAELQAFAATLPRFGDLWLSGGEPFLREDLLEVCAAFIERCGVRTVDLPTNGLFGERAVEFARAFHDRFPATRLFLNVALDGLAATHDRIRGVPGNFAATGRTLEALAALRPGLHRLRVHVNTVVCAANLDEVEAVGQHVIERHRVDGHYFQVIRGRAKDPELLEVPAERLERVHAFAADLHRTYAARMWGEKSAVTAWLRRAAYVGTLLGHYRAQRAVRESDAGWGFPCVAAERALVVEHDGTVKACELRGALANLRDFGMDFRRLSASGLLAGEASDIARRPCPCTHVCFIHTSLRRSPRHLALALLRGAGPALRASAERA